MRKPFALLLALVLTLSLVIYGVSAADRAEAPLPAASQESAPEEPRCPHGCTPDQCPDCQDCTDDRCSDEEHTHCQTADQAQCNDRCPTADQAQCNDRCPTADQAQCNDRCPTADQAQCNDRCPASDQAQCNDRCPASDQAQCNDRCPASDQTQCNDRCQEPCSDDAPHCEQQHGAHHHHSGHGRCGSRCRG